MASNGSRTVVLVEPSDEEFGAMLQEQGLEAALLSRGVGQVLCQITMQDANAVDLSQVKDGFVLRLPVWNGGSGSESYMTVYNDYLSKLQAAGLETVRAFIQAQIDAYLAK